MLTLPRSQILQTVAGGSRGIGYIYAGRVIAGVGVGAISAVSPAFVSECAPKDVRGRITGLFQIMVAVGVMLSYFINRETPPLNPQQAAKLTPFRSLSVGVSLHIKSGFSVWRIPLGFQLVPAGIMAFGLLTVPESPRWLASKGRSDAALRNLAYLRRLPADDETVRHEMAEIEAAIAEEREARRGLGLKEAFFGKGNTIRFVIAIVIFILQQWSGQNSVNYYAPQIFQSVSSHAPSHYHSIQFMSSNVVLYRSATPAHLSLCSRLEFTALSRLWQLPYSYSSSSSPWVVSCRYSSPQSEWAPYSSSLAHSSRRTHRIPRRPPHHQQARQWRQCFTSMFASTPWAGGQCRKISCLLCIAFSSHECSFLDGSMSQISLTRELDTWDWPLQALPSGYSVGLMTLHHTILD